MMMQQEIKVLLINQYAGSDTLGMEYRPFEFAKRWNNCSIKTTVLAGSFSHLRHHNKEIPNRSILEIEYIDNVQYIWVKNREYLGNGFARIVNIVQFIFRSILYIRSILHTAQPSHVILSSTHPFDVLVGCGIKVFRKVHLTYEVHDVWPESPIELGGYKKWHPYVLITLLLHLLSLKVSDSVVSLLPKTKDHFIKQGMSEDKWIYVPNGVSKTDQIRNVATPKKLEEKLAYTQSQGKKSIIYAGSIGAANNFLEIFEFQKLNNEFFTLIVFGDGPAKFLFQQKAIEHKLDITFMGKFERSAVTYFMTYFDFGIIAWNHSPLYHFGVSANKIFDYMKASLPIIQIMDEGHDIITDVGCGITIKKAQSIKHCLPLKKLFEMNSRDIRSLGKKGYDYVSISHDYDNLASRFIRFIGMGEKVPK